jgi:hypothetical protein
MFKRLVSITMFVLLAFSLTACLGINFTSGNMNVVVGSGKMATETRNVSGYDQVVLTGSGDATITVGDGEGITIEAEDNILPLIETSVQSGRLVIGLKPNTSISTTRGLHYKIDAKTLSGVDVTGSGNVSVNAVKTDGFHSNISGSGSVRVSSLQAKTLKATITGSGKMEISAGKVDSQEITISGSGDYTAGSLESATAQATTTGSGTATLWAKDSLNARTSGSGNVRYYGQPNVAKSETGSGRVTGLGNK